jgi:cytochrome c553
MSACAGGPTADSVTNSCEQSGFSSRSSTIVHDGTHLWLTSPDDNQLVQLDPETLEPTLRLETIDGPAQLASAGNWLVATATWDTRIALWDRASGTQTLVATPCGGTGAVVALDPAGDSFAIACPNDRLVIRLDSASGEIDERRELVTFRPTSLLSRDCELLATEATGPTLHRWAMAEPERAEAGAWVSPLPSEAFELPARALRPESAVSLVGALTGGAEGVTAVATRVDHDGPRDRPVETGTYGSVVDGDPRIEPLVLGECGGTYARFDGGENVFSGPVDALHTEAGLWVLNQWTRNLVLLDCETPDQGNAGRVRARADVGAGARGLATDPTGSAVWVDVGFDHAVARLEPTGGEWRATTVRRSVSGQRLSTAAQQGRRHFFDATDSHLTPSGIVACATCHPDGRDDGLTWFLHTSTVQRKVRRTPPVAGGDGALRPLHWDGEFATATELTTSTIRGLMGGDALVIDASTIAAWMRELPLPPARPLSDEERSRADAGRLLFSSPEAGCAGCHSGIAFTDGELHTGVLEPSSDPDARLDSSVTPSLRGVRARAPYFHDGRAVTLSDAVREHRNAQGDRYGDLLTADDIQSLTLYLETL